MPNIGPLELIIVLVVVLLLFGSTKLPKLARSIGEASQEFKKGVSEGGKDDAKALESRPAESRPKPTDKVTMTQAELDALLSEREAQARQAGKDSATE
jgi:sec-independent protein translocase protein TatA